jgi:hypothetical protein
MRHSNGNTFSVLEYSQRFTYDEALEELGLLEIQAFGCTVYGR